MDEDAVEHFSHPHMLKPGISGKVFICVGCKERGWGHRFSCEDCKFYLHKDCVLAPPRMKQLFFEESILVFCDHRMTEDAYCIACERMILGFTYAFKNGEKHVHLHPCCAQLPSRLGDEQYELRERISSKCDRCGRKDDGWAYRNKKRDYHFHVSCLFEMAIQKHEKERLKEIGGDKLIDKVNTYEHAVEHFSHQHVLKPKISSNVFICVGCKEKGWVDNYSCEDCKYYLHKNCVLAPPQIKHPFLGKSILNFHHHTMTENASCIACKRVILGFRYANIIGKMHVHLHPSCAQLPFRLEDEQYVLRERISAKCGRCGRKDGGWAYRNKKKDYHFHVSCLSEMEIVKFEKERLKEIGGDKLLDKVSMTPNL